MVYIHSQEAANNCIFGRLRGRLSNLWQAATGVCPDVIMRGHARRITCVGKLRAVTTCCFVRGRAPVVFRALPAALLYLKSQTLGLLFTI